MRFDGSSTAANRRIQRGKHARRFQHLGLRQRVEQRRLARIRVAHQRHGRDRRRLAPLPLLRSNAPDIFYLLLYVAHAPRNLAAIGFQLGFTGTARANAAAQLRHLHAVPGQPRHHVLQLRQLDLQLAFAGARMPRKNVEDELRAVDHAPLNDFFNIALLRRTEIVIEEQHVGVDRGSRASNFFQLARANQRRRIGPVAPLQNLADHLRPGAFRQCTQFGQRFVGVEFWNAAACRSTLTRRRASSASRPLHGPQPPAPSPYPFAPRPRVRTSMPNQKRTFASPDRVRLP